MLPYNHYKKPPKPSTTYILNRIRFFIAAVSALFQTPGLLAQDLFAGYEHLFTPPRQYTAYQTNETIRIDGKLKETAWNDADWSDYFTDIEGDKKPAPPFKTRFKLLWDSQYLYVAAELEEPNIQATLKEHDAIIYAENDFEIFINPDGDTQNYFEIEVNALNSVFDLFLTKPYRNGGIALLTWDVQHLKSAVSVKGTLNKAKDTDKKWLVEMAIPLRSLSLGFKELHPAEGTCWRVNFSRVEYDSDIINGSYVKKADSTTHRPLPEHNWVWSPQGMVNMHMPERWGYLRFSSQKPGSLKTNFSLPPAETWKKYLWLLFYKQQQYRLQNQRYATILSQLNFPPEIDGSGLNCYIILQATGRQYTAVLHAIPGDEWWQIDQEGKIIKAVNHDQ
jgi:hypothetical protein